MARRKSFASRHPRLVAAGLVGPASAIGVDHWVWTLTDQQLAWTAASVGLLVWVTPPVIRGYQSWTGRRYGQVYRYWLYWHEDVMAGLPPEQCRFDYDGYVGQSRMRHDRHLQHLGISKRYPGPPSPWSDLIANPGGVPELLYESERFTQARLDRLEEQWVRQHGTTYNHEFNTWNQYRVPVPQARRERAMRDAARLGTKRWIG